MGYESKLIVVNQFEGSDIFGDIIAEINLSGMPNEFFVDDVFDKKLQGGLFIVRNGEAVNKDAYGKPLKYSTSVENVLKVLYKCEAKEHYRRTKLAIDTLECFSRSSDWASDKIAIIHYGY